MQEEDLMWTGHVHRRFPLIHFRATSRVIHRYQEIKTRVLKSVSLVLSEILELTQSFVLSRLRVLTSSFTSVEIRFEKVVSQIGSDLCHRRKISSQNSNITRLTTAIGSIWVKSNSKMNGWKSWILVLMLNNDDEADRDGPRAFQS
jgi:hypothetical protein